MTTRFLLAAILLLAVLLPALAEPRAWSGDGNFSLIPPAGWTVSKPSRNTLIFTSGKSDLEIECHSKAVPITDPAYKAQVSASVDPQEYKVLSQADTVLSGMNAVQCELEGVGPNADRLGRFVVMTDKNRTWLITYSSPRPESAEAFGRVEEALVTLQLK